MFVAIDQVFTLENILYLAKGALLSVAIAALSLLIGLVLGILGASGRRSKCITIGYENQNGLR